MHRLRSRTDRCDRARHWLSLELDGELSELERAALDSHLAGCESCRTFATEIAGLTAALRAAPQLALNRPVTLVRRSGTPGRLVQVGAAAAVLVASLVSFSQLTSSPNGRLVRYSGPAVIQNGVDQIRQERMVKRTAPAAAVARPGHARRPSDDF